MKQCRGWAQKNAPPPLLIHVFSKLVFFNLSAFFVEKSKKDKEKKTFFDPQLTKCKYTEPLDFKLQTDMK